MWRGQDMKLKDACLPVVGSSRISKRLEQGESSAVAYPVSNYCSHLVVFECLQIGLK